MVVPSMAHVCDATPNSSRAYKTRGTQTGMGWLLLSSCPCLYPLRPPVSMPWCLIWPCRQVRLGVMRGLCLGEGWGRSRG